MSETAVPANVAAPTARKWWWLGLPVVLALGMVFWWWRGPLVMAEPVVRREFVQSVVASGRVETPNRVGIGAQITATVKRVRVDEGQPVKAGEVVLELEAAELQAAQAQAAATLAQAENRVRQLREVQGPVAEQRLRQAQVTLDNARATLKRNQELFQKQFIGIAALDESRKSVDLAEAQMRGMQKQLDTTRAGGSDDALAASNVMAARAALDAAQARLRYTRIAASTAGTVLARHVEVGDVVQPGKVLLTLSPAGRVQLVVQIDEKNLRLLATGQKALASADAYAQQRFAATVASINPAVNAQTGAVEVKLDVPQPPAVLRQDMTVSVDIEVARKPAVLLLPLATVHDPDGKAPWVLQVQDGVLVRKNVRLGLQGGGWAEVLEGGRVGVQEGVHEGVHEGDLLLPVSNKTGAGARVRVRPAKT